MHDLVVGALQEGGIDRAERFETFGRHAGRERHRMLFGDAHIEGAIGTALLEQVEAGARGHRGRDGDDPGIDLRLADQFLRKDGCVGRQAAF